MSDAVKLTGLDPSVGRTSQCVAVVIDYNPQDEVVKVRDPIVGNHDNLPAVVEWIEEMEDEEPSDYIGVDIIGLGRGAHDYLRLKEFGSRVHPFIASAKPSLEWERVPGIEHKAHCDCTGCLMERSYSNYKSRVAHQFRQHAYKGKVKVPDHELLKRDLEGYVLKKMNGRWKVEDPKVSPDFGDALFISFAGIDHTSTVWIGD